MRHDVRILQVELNEGSEEFPHGANGKRSKCHPEKEAGLEKAENRLCKDPEAGKRPKCPKTERWLEWIQEGHLGRRCNKRCN